MSKRGYRFWDVKRNCYAPDDDFWITYKGEWATHKCSQYADYKGEDIIAEQSSGLRDKNSKEIYEGDIVLVSDPEDYGDGPEWSEHSTHFIKWMDGYPAFDLSPQLDTDSNGLQYALEVQSVEVTGNIHETPELLKGANT